MKPSTIAAGRVSEGTALSFISAAPTAPYPLLVPAPAVINRKHPAFWRASPTV